MKVLVKLAGIRVPEPTSKHRQKRKLIAIDLAAFLNVEQAAPKKEMLVAVTSNEICCPLDSSWVWRLRTWKKPEKTWGSSWDGQEKGWDKDSQRHFDSAFETWNNYTSKWDKARQVSCVFDLYSRSAALLCTEDMSVNQSVEIAPLAKPPPKDTSIQKENFTTPSSRRSRARRHWHGRTTTIQTWSAGLTSLRRWATKCTSSSRCSSSKARRHRATTIRT